MRGGKGETGPGMEVSQYRKRQGERTMKRERGGREKRRTEREWSGDTGIERGAKTQWDKDCVEEREIPRKCTVSGEKSRDRKSHRKGIETVREMAGLVRGGSIRGRTASVGSVGISAVEGK